MIRLLSHCRFLEREEAHDCRASDSGKETWDLSCSRTNGGSHSGLVVAGRRRVVEYVGPGDASRKEDADRLGSLVLLVRGLFVVMLGRPFSF